MTKVYSLLAVLASKNTITNGLNMTKKPSIEELGTIVNDITPDAEVEAVEKQIQDFSDTEVTIKLSAPLHERLKRLAQFKTQDISEYCLSVLDESIAEQEGRPTISGPSNLSDNAVAKKVTGPSFLTNKL